MIRNQRANVWLVFLTTCLGMELLPVQSDGVASAPRVGVQADRILQQMSEYLRGANELTFKASITHDSVLPNGQHIQYGSKARVAVKRPDRLHIEAAGDKRQSRFFLDGQTLTFLNTALNVYARLNVPPNIDDAIDLLFKEHGFSLPLADLVYSNPYDVLMERVGSGFRVGRHLVDDVHCHHLAFTQEAIDWQIWIEDGPRPVPRKVVITYHNEPGAPQFTAHLSDWDLDPNLSEYVFIFHPPRGADEIEFLPKDQKEVHRD